MSLPCDESWEFQGIEYNNNDDFSDLLNSLAEPMDELDFDEIGERDYDGSDDIEQTIEQLNAFNLGEVRHQYRQYETLPVNLVSAGSIRILQFDIGNLRDVALSTSEFYTSAGDNFDYKTLYNALGPVRFLLHFCHAKHSAQGDINFPGLEKSFVRSELNDILKAVEKGCVTLIDEQYRENIWNVSWQHYVCNYLEKQQVVNTDTVPWQDALNQVMNSNTHIIPVNAFTVAKVNTFDVNYMDLRDEVGAGVFNNLFRTGLFVFMQGAYMTTKPMGIIALTESNRSVVATKRRRDELEQQTVDEQYNQVKKYYEDLRDKYKTSEHRDANLFVGNELLYTNCYKPPEKLQCKFCSHVIINMNSAGERVKVNHGPHLRSQHPLLYAVVRLNAEKPGKKINFPLQLEQSVVDAYEHVLW